jgi:predicted secreted hydrolase
MKNIQYTNSGGVPHGTMADEFLCHRHGSEWWYCTGFLNAESGELFSFQFTLARVRIYGVQFHILMTAVTDFETGKELALSMNDKDYALELKMEAVKPPVWHAENGVLKMGVEHPKEKTYYWSYTNLAASGTLVLAGKEYKLAGKAWFDKQGGTYTLTSRWTNWEWFSLRFFDGEEVMLFSFPQDNYQDGTYIEKSGNYRRLNDYKITPLGFTEASGKKFSCGWKVAMAGIKDEQYTIVPKIEGQLNLFYYELLADIKDKDGKEVGYCVVELLPGVYNEKMKISAAWAQVKS